MDNQNISKKRMISGLGWAYGERITAQTVSFIVSIILARLLDPEHYGTVALVTVFISILNALVTGGFGNALVQKKDATEKDFNTICWFSIAVSLLLYLVLFLCSPLIANFYNMEILSSITKVMGFRIVISAFNSIQHAYVQRTMQFKKFFFSTLGGTIVSAVVGIVLAYLGFGVWALVAQYMTNSVIDTIVLLITIEWRPAFEFSKESFSSLFSYGIKMLGATVINTLQINLRSLIIGKVFSAEDLAYYNRGQQFPSLLMENVIGSMQKVLLPGLAKQQTEIDELKQTMRQSVRLSSFILIPAIIGLMAVSKNFILLLLTEKWISAVPYLCILSLVYIARPLNMVFQSGLLAIGKSECNLVHEVVCSIASIVLVVLSAFILKNVRLVAWSYVAVMILGTFIFGYYVIMHLDYSLSEMIRDYCPYFFSALFMGGIVYSVYLIKLPTLISLIVQILIGTCIYIGIAKMFRFKELAIVSNIIKSMYKRIHKGRSTQ